VAKRKRQ